MLTYLLAAGWHYLPNFKDVAAEVPLPNFIFAGEMKMIVMGRGVSSSLLQLSRPSAANFAAPHCTCAACHLLITQHHLQRS